MAQIDETRARVLVAEKKYAEANRIIAAVIKTFEAGGDAALLADALTVQGVIWARLGGYESSTNVLHQAAKVAQDAGALTNAGLAKLTLIEEHGARRLSEEVLFKTYQRADDLLKDTQDAEAMKRLRGCARLILNRLAGAWLHAGNFSLPGAMHDLEARFIEQALTEAGGSVTRAAKLLGVARQSLVVALAAVVEQCALGRAIIPPGSRLRLPFRQAEASERGGVGGLGGRSSYGMSLPVCREISAAKSESVHAWERAHEWPSSAASAHPQIETSINPTSGFNRQDIDKT